MPKLRINKFLQQKSYREPNGYIVTKKYKKQHVKNYNLCMYLHCTSIFAVSVALPHSLLASHL